MSVQLFQVRVQLTNFFLGRRARLLGYFAFADITNGQNNQQFFVNLERAQADLGGENAPLTAAGLDFSCRSGGLPRTISELIVRGRESFETPFGYQDLYVLTEQVTPLIAEQRFGP